MVYRCYGYSKEAMRRNEDHKKQNQTGLCLNHFPPTEPSALDDKETASEVSLTAPVAAEETSVMGDMMTLRSDS